MAKVKKESKSQSVKVSKYVGPWLENKIERTRKVLRPRSARASRYGAPAGVALIILLISLSLFLPKDQLQQAKERLARNSDDFEAHLILAEAYLKDNQLEAAERELLIAQQIQQSGYQTTPQPKTGILGITTSTFSQLWQRKMASNPEDIRRLIEYWEKIVAEKPDYRDGYLQLAILHYKLYENEKAKEYLQKALELDPNFQPARELEKILM